MDSLYIPSLNTALSNARVILDKIGTEQRDLKLFCSLYGAGIYVDFRDDDELKFRFEATENGEITHLSTYIYVLSRYDEYAVDMVIVDELLQRGREIVKELVGGERHLRTFMDASGSPMMRLTDKKGSTWACLFAEMGVVEATGRDVITVSLRVRLRS